MARFQFTGTEPRDYPTLGFRATNGAVAELTANPGDGYWTSVDGATPVTLPPALVPVSPYTPPLIPDDLVLDGELTAALASINEALDERPTASDVAGSYAPKAATETAFAGLAGRFAPKLVAELDLREWTEGLPNDGESDCRALFVEVMADLAALTADTGLFHIGKVPGGHYQFDGGAMSPPLGGGFGLRGEGMGATTFLTSDTGAWLGMTQFTFGDASFRWENMLFEDFTIDGSAQPIGTSYTAALKGFSANNARHVVIRRVKVKNTHATGFGWDYCDQLRFVECVAEGNGRARLVHTPLLDDRIGSGSGFGIGFGSNRDEHVELIACISRDNAAAGAFGEQLAQPEAMKHASGLTVIGGLFEGNTTGINDAGTHGSRFQGATLRKNLLAGFRAGNSFVGERGGSNGIAADLLIYANQHGVILDGQADAAYNLHDMEVRDNTGHGVWWRSKTSWSYPGRGVKLHHSHIHHNGGCGVFGDTTMPIPELDLDSNDIHDNGQDIAAARRDEVCFTAPLARPRIRRNRLRSGHGGYALALRGAGVQTVDPDISGNDLAGSAGGEMLVEHTVNVTTGITGNRGHAGSTVSQTMAYPYPAVGSLGGWAGAATTRSYVAGGPTIEGVAVPGHVQGIATGSSPRLTATTGGSAAAGDLLMCSIYAKAPAGKSYQPHARMDSGSLIYGPIMRATGEWQRLDMLISAPTAATQVGVGVVGIDVTLPWVAGDVLQATCANVTRGPLLWPYIDGTQPHCAWVGAAPSTASTLTIPASTVL